MVNNSCFEKMWHQHYDFESSSIDLVSPRLCPLMTIVTTFASKSIRAQEIERELGLPGELLDKLSGDVMCLLLAATLLSEMERGASWDFVKLRTDGRTYTAGVLRRIWVL
jgi:hypothetical protein